MRKGIEPPKSYFPSPWLYFNVPLEDVEGLLALYVELYLNLANPTLPRAIQQVMHPEHLARQLQYRYLFTPEAHEAAKFFVIADHIGQKYQRYHPEFKMVPMPPRVLKHLKSPYNGMTDMGYDDQKKYRDALPNEQLKKEVYLDE